MNCKLWPLSRFLFFVICFGTIKRANSSCSSDLEKCTSAVNPLLKNVSYMFPSTKEEVIQMCSTWGSIVECVRHYMKKCLSQSRKKTFNMAVENSIGTVHSICVAENVQRQYLANSECLRNVSVRNCKLYFDQLVDIVANSKAKDDHICCAYAKFRKCVDVPLTIQCGDLFRNLMDHSLTFLIQKCNFFDSSLNLYDDCQLPAELTASSPTQRKLDDAEQKNRFDSTNSFYPIYRQFVAPYPTRNKEESGNYRALSNEDGEPNESTSMPSNREGKSVNDKQSELSSVDDEFQLNQAGRFSRQDDEFENKHREYSTESPEYMMSHFSPEELHNCSSLPNYTSHLIGLLLVLYLFKSFR